MNTKFKEMRNHINYLKKKERWYPENTEWSKTNWELVLFDEYKTKKISLNEFIVSSINLLFEKYNPNLKKPSFEGAIVPTWYDCENKTDYMIKLIHWFIKTVVFPDNYVWNDSEKRGVIILPPCEYTWTDESVHVYNEIIEYYGLTE